jgi:hypothetical protein
MLVKINDTCFRFKDDILGMFYTMRYCIGIPEIVFETFNIVDPIRVKSALCHEAIELYFNYDSMR